MDGSIDPGTGLARVREPAPDAAGDRVGEIGVPADDLRVLLPSSSTEPFRRSAQISPTLRPPRPSR